MLSLDRKKLYKILEISSIFVGVLMTLYYFYPVFASPPTTPYAPGETTDPSCSPGDTNCTVYPPLTTSLTTSTAIIMGTHSLRFAYDASNYTSFVIASDGGLTVSSTNAATTTFSNKTLFSSSVYFNTIASGTWNGVAIAAAYGGTNSSTMAANGSIIYSDGARYNATAVGVAGQFLQSAGSGVPVWVNSTSMGFVNLQGATAGTQQTGNLNISGTGLFGTRVGINTTTLTSYALAVSGTTYTADLIAKGGVFVDVRAYGATNDASTDSTAAIQAAIDAAYLNLGNAVGGVVYLPAGVYYISGTLNITNSRIHIYGAGKNATFITFNPGSAGLPAFHFNGGASVLFQDSISDLSINGQGGLQKIGIQLTDTSEMLVEDVSMLYMNGDSSIGIKLRGREMTTLNRITLSADRPIVISDNPNSTIDVDHLHVEDAYLVASGTNPNVTIDSGVNLTNVVFDGTQAWVLGGYGLQWIDTSTVAASANLSIKNVRWEQSTYPSGYFIDIEHNSVLQNLVMENLYGGLSTNGIKLRKINWATLENFMYVDTTKTALDVNTTTYPLVFKNVFFQQGSTSTFGGLTTITDSGRDTIGGTTFGLAVFDVPSGTGVSSLYRLTVGTTTLNANPFSVVSSSAAGGSMLSLLTNGRFGINSSSPIASLALQGTGGSNPFSINSSTGSSLLSILQNGNVGIGTAAPGKLLELYQNDGTAPELKINNGYTTHSQGVSNTGYVRFSGLVAPGGNNNVEDKFLMGLRSGAINTAWDFIVRDTVASADRLVINQNGDMSIGTSTSITATLTVQARGGINPFVINSSTGNPMLNLLTNGNVGIGVTTPAAKLHIISANSGGIDDLIFSNDASGNYRNGIRNLQSSASAAGNMMEFVVGNGTATGETPVMYLLGDGRVGISTTTPPAQLSLYRLLATSTPSFDISSSTGLSMFRVSANGNVGIGSSTPSEKLSLVGNIGLTSDAASFGAGGGEIRAIINSTTQYRFLSIQSDTANAGPFVMETYSPLFSGTRDPALHWGYNQSGGANILSGEPSLVWGLEGNYNDGSGDNKMEAYLQYVSATGTNARPIFFQINRDTNYLTSYLKGDLIRFNANDGAAEGGSVEVEITKNNLTIYAPNTSTFTALTVNAAAGQAGVLNLGYNGSNSYLQMYTNATNSASIYMGSNAILNLFPSPIGAAGAAISVGVLDNAAVATFDVAASNAAVKGLVVRAKSTQTANIFEAQNSASIPLVVISPTGKFGIGTSSPIATLSVVATSSNGNNPIFEVASSSGSSFLRVLANGNVGINSSSPIDTLSVQGGLQVVGSVTSTNLYISGISNFGNTTFTNVTTTNLNVSSLANILKLGINSSSPAAQLSVQGTGTANPFTILSSTNSSMLTVLTNGNVGIGNAAPGAALEVTTASAVEGLRMSFASDVRYYNSIVNVFSATPSSNYIAFKVNNGTASTQIETMRLRGDGLVGLGTITPSAKFSISSTATGTPLFDISSSTGDILFRVLANGNVGIGTSSPIATLSVVATSSNGNNPIFEVASSSGTSFLRVLANGNVGINTTTPVSTFAVVGTTTIDGGIRVGDGTNSLPSYSFINDTDTGLWLDSAGASFGAAVNGAYSIRFLPGGFTTGAGGTASAAAITLGGDTNTGFWAPTSDQLAVTTNGVNRLIVSTTAFVFNPANLSGFNVGIGTTTPIATFSIQGNTSSNPFEIASSTGTSLFRILQNGNVGINSSSPIASFALQGMGGFNPFSINSSTGASLLSILTNGRVGINTSTPTSLLGIQGTGITSTTQSLGIYNASSSLSLGVLDDNSVIVDDGAVYHDGTGKVTYVNSLETGNLSFPDDAGTVTWTNLNASSSAVGTVQSYTASIGDNPMITVYGESDGTGGIKATSTMLGIGTSTPQYFVDIWTTSSPQGLFRIATTTNLGILAVRANGNVGIGSSTPSNPLTVQSDSVQLKLATNSGPDAYNTTLSAIYNSAHPFALTVTNAGNSVENIGIYADNGGTNRRITLLNANVAINTTTNVGTKFIIQGDGTTNPFSVVSSTAAASSMFTILTNGRVGINTSSPIAMLAVQGFDGINPFSINSSTGASMLTVLTNGNVGINSSSPQYTLGVDGYISGQRVYTGNPNVYFGSDVSGILVQGGYLYANGTGTSLYVQNAAIFRGALSNDTATYLQFNGGTSGYNYFNGNVGIGTSTPSARLEVWGTGNTSSTVALNTYSASGTSTFKIDNAGNASFANDGFYYEASSSVSYINSFETGGLNFDDNAGFVSWVDMEVSSTVAGTSNAYTASIDGNPMIQVYGDSNGTGGVTNMTVSIGTSTTSTVKLFVVGSEGKSIVDFASSTGTSILRITAGSRVGIGTTTPTARFMVQGAGTENPFSIVSSTAVASSMFTILTDGRVGINSSSPIAVLAVQGTDGINPFSVNSSTGAPLLSVLTNGRVAIGTTTPIGTLAIQGSGTANPFMVVSSTAAGIMMFGVSTNGNVNIGSSAVGFGGSLTIISGSASTLDLNRETDDGTIVNIMQGGNIEGTISVSGVTVSYNAFTGSHYGWTDTTIERGQLVSLTGYNRHFHNNPLSEILYGIAPSATINDSRVLGSYLSIQDPSKPVDDENPHLVMSVGNGDLWVVENESGDVAIGDYLISSDTSGHAMKDPGTFATSYVVARATEVIDWETVTDMVDGKKQKKIIVTFEVFSKNGIIKTLTENTVTYPLDPACDTNGNCPQAGDVVCAAEGVSATSFIERCSATSTDSIIGVVSSNSGTSSQPVALSGYVSVNISTANGPIKAGDYLTSSVVPGVAVKALEPGKVIGMALEAFDGSVSATGSIKISANTSWSFGSLFAEGISDEMPDFATVVLDKFTLAVKNSLRKLGLLLKNGVATVKEVFADKVTTQQLCVGNTCVNESQLQEILNKTQTQAAAPASTPPPVIPTSSPIVIPTEAPDLVGINSADEGSLSTTTPDSNTTTTPPVVIPVEVETETQPSTIPDVTIPVDPVIVIVETTTP